MKRAYISGPMPGGFNTNQCVLMGKDSELLGLQSSAKEFLKARYSRASKSNKCVRDTNKAINGLDTKFAECATRFLQAWERQNGTVTITSAFRDYNDQLCVCPVPIPGKCGRAGKSKHQFGVALDVLPQDQSYAGWKRFHAAARSFGGVAFVLGFRDKVHLQSTGAQCASGDGGSTADPYIASGDQGYSSGYPGTTPSFGGQNQWGYGQSQQQTNADAQRAPYDAYNQNAEAQALAQQNAPSENNGPVINGPSAADGPLSANPDVQEDNLFGTNVPATDAKEKSTTQERPQTEGSVPQDAVLPSAITTKVGLSPARISCAPRTASRGATISVSWRCPAGTTSRGESTNALFTTDGKRFGVTKVRLTQSAAFTVYCAGEGVDSQQASCTVRAAAPQVRTTPTTQTSDISFDGTPQKKPEKDVSQPQTCFLGFCL